MKRIAAGAIGKRHLPPTESLRRHLLGLPKTRAALLWGLRAVGGAYARLGLKLDGIEFRHPDRILEAWRDFREGRSRLILAFRHPYGDEPQLLSLALALGLGREARIAGSALEGPGHALFVHGYEVPLWSGPLVRWLLPRVGAMPVYHVKLDKAGLQRIRSTLLNGDFPLALAPEGQSSYRSETLPRLEQGTARLAFWCARDLRAAGRGERVVVLPLSVNYRYEQADIGRLEDLVSLVEADCGVAGTKARAPKFAAGADGGSAHARRMELAGRIVALDERLIAQAELYYSTGRPLVAGADRDARLAALMEEALRRGEAMLGLKADGDLIARVYRIRQEGWDRIYPETDPHNLSPLGRRLADRKAGEAWYAMRHMEFVDLCYYLDSAYLRTGDGSAPDFGRLVEAAYSAADLASRLSGGNITHRPNTLRHTAVLSVGTAIELGSRFDDYQKDRKAAVEAATQELGRAFKACIEEYINDRKS